MAKTTTKEIVKTKFQTLFLAARDVSVPLIVVRTADPAETLREVVPVSINSDSSQAVSVFAWDAARGIFDATGTVAGAQQARALNGSFPMVNPVEVLTQAAPKLTRDQVLVLFNGHDYYSDPVFRQAMWNLRDTFKMDGRTLVVTQPSGTPPAALEHDVYVIDQPLPDAQALRRIVSDQYEAAGMKLPGDDVLASASNCLAGLSGFAAEQATVLSFTRDGLDMTGLRDRHRQMIENTKGLHVWRGGETFDSLGGLQSVKAFMTRLVGGVEIGSVVWIDEVEKALAGTKGDMSGITQYFMGTLLSYMQDHQVFGVLLMGHPGTGKSALAKALGNTAGVPTVRMDFGEMQGSLVGDSQHAIQHALKVTTAVSQGHPLFIATCNSVAILPPEFVNRFQWRFFVDMPDDDEKPVIWDIQRRANGISPKDEQPLDTDWNGREIWQCCVTARALKCSLLEASQTVVPIALSSKEDIDRRRMEAAGRYLSASRPGTYTAVRESAAPTGRRKHNVSRDAWLAPEGQA